jgi:hypothetical protein
MSAAVNPADISLDPAQAALAALARAGLRAAEDAKRANTQMVVAENGQVVRMSPQEYLRLRAEQNLPQTAKDGI